MKKSHIFVAATIAVVSFSTYSFATVTQSLGVGSAVSSINATADFESINALNDNHYVEAGLKFSRTNLSFDNNGCGYAGCPENIFDPKETFTASILFA
ncbi:MAG: hypothetical protein ABFS24_12830 [Pseudomonadota bacterium]